VSRNSARYHLDLMKVAYLHGYAYKRFDEAVPSVNDHSCDSPSLYQKRLSSIHIDISRFMFCLFPPQILLKRWRLKHADAIFSPPECHINNSDSWLWHKRRRFWYDCVKLRAYPATAFAYARSKLLRALSLPDEVTKQYPLCP